MHLKHNNVMTSSKGFNPVKVSPSSTDIGKPVSNIKIQSKNLLLLEINAINRTFISNIRRLKLHRDPAKCIRNRACKNDQDEDRTYVFDHHNEDFLSAECTLTMTDFLFYLIDSHNS